ncbi:MAG TPA: glucoamylase family protein [Bacteroidales bacterium]|nr:glucoamylase family protein [Bacteroidales bacterium]
MDSVIYKSESQLDKLQHQTFNFFRNEANPANGLVADKTLPDGPAGIASTGFALSSYPIAVERGFISRNDATERILNTLRFFLNSRHGPEPEATGYHGFYYKFLDMNKGRRARMSEISFLDSSILFAGALTVSAYFDRNDGREKEIRYLSDELYRKADWSWALNNGDRILHGWKPETGFENYAWNGYDEGFLIYILGLGAPDFTLPQNSFTGWTAGYEWINFYGHDYLYSAPLFVHQLPHCWIDFRGIRDEYMKKKNSDYFENSKKATIVQYRYAVENPGKYECYGKYFWGITLSDGPGPLLTGIKGTDREFLGFAKRGVPFGPDDGTVSPWSAVASIAFSPDLVIPAIEYLLHETDLNMLNSYGFRSAFNPTFPHKPHNPHGWRSPYHLGINQGPAMMMIENYRSGLIWNLLRDNSYIKAGLLKAGFTEGWLSEEKKEKSTIQYNHAGR